MLSIFQDSRGDPVFEQKVEGSPYAVVVSRNDRYVALKFSRYIQIFDVVSKECFHHELPYKNSRSGPSNNLVAFSSDSASVIASTRYEPEKVITYWSECTKPCKTNNVESSAPFVSNNFIIYQPTRSLHLGTLGLKFLVGSVFFLTS